jgi:hypothetical protein
MYKVTIPTGEYSARQQQANDAKADLYLEQHVNSSVSESPDYGLGVVAENASQKSRSIAAWYAAEAGKRFDVGGPTDADIGYGTGVRVGGRGNSNLKYTSMPAVLLEPWFASNPRQAEMMNSVEGVGKAAELLLDLVQKWLPDGGHIFLSVGHVGKPSNPSDKGAAIVRGTYATEGEWAKAVVFAAKRDIESFAKPVDVIDPPRRILKVLVDHEVVGSIPLPMGSITGIVIE